MKVLSAKTAAVINLVLYPVIRSSTLNEAAPHVTRQLAVAVKSGKFASNEAVDSLQEAIASTGWKSECVSKLMVDSETELKIFLKEVLKLYQTMGSHE